MTPAITGGDVDVDVEDAYFTGDEAPGGDNPTPDQDIVDDIGKALGVEYQDNEELKASDKVVERDKHRWELDPGVVGGLQGQEVELSVRAELALIQPASLQPHHRSITSRTTSSTTDFPVVSMTIASAAA